MAIWDKENCKITVGGKNLLAQLQAGEQLEIVRVVCGSNAVDTDVLENQTEILDIKKELEYRKIVDVSGNSATFFFMLTNAGVTEAFPIKQIGIYAREPGTTDGEILYIIMQASGDIDIIPTEASMPNFQEAYKLKTLFENEAGFSVTVDPIGMVTEEEFQALFSDFVDLYTDFQNRVVGESGLVNLINNQQYPFNNSQKTVSLQAERKNINYEVFLEVTSSVGAVKHVYVTDKQVNGFKIQYTGSATETSIRYLVRGGMDDGTRDN